MSIMITGCNANNPDHSSMSNKESVPNESYTETQKTVDIIKDVENREDTKGDAMEDTVLKAANVYQYSNKAEIDLDGDGSVDFIEMTEDGAQLIINGKQFRIEDESTKFPEAKFTIIDFNTMDSYIEIVALGEQNNVGMDDCLMCMFRYKEQELVCIGGLISGMRKGDITFDGLNHLYQRYHNVDIQETNYITAQFTINEEEKFEMMYPEEGYYYPTYERHTCELLVNLPVYAEKNLELEPYMIKPQTVRFRRTDAKNWVEVVAEDGTVGWMYVEEGYFMKDLNMRTEEVFEGLWFVG